MNSIISRIAQHLTKRTYEGRCEQYFKRTLFLGKHPFTENHDHQIVEYVGDGSSYAIAAFIDKLIDFADEEVMEVIEWRYASSDNKDHHFIFLEWVTQHNRFLIGGMTNFSGTGYSAYKENKEIIQFLSDGKEIKTQFIDEQKGFDLEKEVSELILMDERDKYLYNEGNNE